jgi:uncharacterized membrane protein YebE (DUF533 family)
MSALSQMKLLINLARIDGSVAEHEKNYITNIGRANGIYPDEIKPLFDQKHEPIVPDDLTNASKFQYIVSLVQLMKIDERMYKEEIQFCSSIANKLGYKKEVMFELMLHVKPGVMSEKEMKNLELLTEKHLK